LLYHMIWVVAAFSSEQQNPRFSKDSSNLWCS
jgi:hypothetical protein